MPILFVVTADDTVPHIHTSKLKNLAVKAKFHKFFGFESESNMEGFMVTLKDFVRESVLKYDLDDFDEWSDGAKWKKDKGQKILHYENEKNSKIKITHTKLPKGAIKKILEKQKKAKSTMAEDLEKIRAKHKAEMADLTDDQL